MPQWGIYDTQDNVWYGGDDGPKLLDDEMLARAALTILHAQLPQEFTMRTDGWRAPRLQVLGWIDGGPLRVRDEVTPRMTARQALKRIERGTII